MGGTTIGARPTAEPWCDSFVGCWCMLCDDVWLSACVGVVAGASCTDSNV